MNLAVKQERHFINMECEQEAEKMIRRGVAPWRAREEACRIVESRRAKSGNKSRKR